MIDEIAALSSLHQHPPGVIFIELKKHDKPWLFNLDEYDESRFYKPVAST